MTPIFAITEQYKYRRRILSYACLFLLLVCFADTSVAQSPTAPTVSISLDQPNATVWEGGTIRFKVEIDRPLVGSEQLSVSLKYSTRTSVPTQGASVSQVSGDGLNNGVTLADLDNVEAVGGTTIFQTTATFVAGAQTATLQWKFGNDNVLGEDRNAKIVIDRIESNISPTPIANPDNDTLAVTVWEDEYRIDFERSPYVIEEANNAELKLIISGGDRVTNFGLQTITRVTFEYS